MADSGESNPYYLRERKQPKLKSKQRKWEQQKNQRAQRHRATDEQRRYADEIQSNSSDEEKLHSGKNTKPKSKKQTIKSTDSTTSQQYFTPPSEQIPADPINVPAASNYSQQKQFHASLFQILHESGAPADPDVFTPNQEPAATDVTQFINQDNASADFALLAGATANQNTGGFDVNKKREPFSFDQQRGACSKISPARLILPTGTQREQTEERVWTQSRVLPPISPFFRSQHYTYRAAALENNPVTTLHSPQHPRDSPTQITAGHGDSAYAAERIDNRAHDGATEESDSQQSEVEGQDDRLQRNPGNISASHSSDTVDNISDTSDNSDHSDTDPNLADEDGDAGDMANNRLLAAVATRPSLFDGLKPEKARQWWNSVDRYAAFAGIEGEHKARLVGMMFKGVALHWYEGLPDATQTDINQLTNAFREKFIEPGPNMLQQQIDALSQQQKADETVEEFASEARTRLSNLGYNANQQMTMIINGFRPDIKSVVLQHMPFADVNALINKAKHVEQALKSYVAGKITTKAEDSKNDDVKSAIDKLTANVTAMQRAVETGSSPNRGRGRGRRYPTARPTQGVPAEKRCYICNSPHHLQRDCLQSHQDAKPCCYTCGSDRHFRRDCPQEQANQRSNGGFNRGQFTGRGHGRVFNRQGTPRGRQFTGRGAGGGRVLQGTQNPGAYNQYNQWEN